MIAPQTGMKPGQRYRIESVERAPQFSGFFLDGRYYLGLNCRPPSAGLKGKCFSTTSSTLPVSRFIRAGIAGTIEGLTLVMPDGLRLEIEEAPYLAEPLAPVRASLTGRIERISRQPIRPSPLLVAGAAMLVGVCLLTISRIRNR